MNKIVTKFGGSSLADASQFKKVKNIITADPARKYVVPSTGCCALALKAIAHNIKISIFFILVIYSFKCQRQIFDNITSYKTFFS